MKRLLACFLALLTIFTLAACGGKASDAPAAAEAPAATEAPAAEAPADAQTEELKVLADSANALAALYNELVPIAKENGWGKRRNVCKRSSRDERDREIGWRNRQGSVYSRG